MIQEVSREILMDVAYQLDCLGLNKESARLLI